MITSCATPAASWHYEIAVEPGSVLSVDASFRGPTVPELSSEPGMARFVRDLTIEGRPPVEHDGSWAAPECNMGCKLHYRFLLGEAAKATSDLGWAADFGGTIIAPPSSWLLRPARAPRDLPFEFHVRAAPGESFDSGLFLGDRPDSFKGVAGDLPNPPLAVFGKFTRRTLTVGGGELDLAVLPGALSLSSAQIDRWLTACAEVVSAYFHRFPVKRVLILLIPGPGKKPGSARTFGNGGAAISAPIGEQATLEELLSDWVMVHEMVHLGFPDLPRRYLWIEEGIATYVEPLARARLGRLPATEVWRDMIGGMERGLPEADDQGLDGTSSWGRIYWGGALFCFLADLEIRERTHNQRSFDDALRGVQAEGGSANVGWDLDRALAAGDRAVGLPVLTRLHDELGLKRGAIDLPAIFARLGVSLVGDQVKFDDRAPLAAIRRALTATISLR